MSTSSFRFQLTDLTYEDLVSAARVFAAAEYPDWDFDSEVDIARFALDIFLRAQVQEIEVANAWAQEAFLTAARLRQSVLAHAVARGYAPRSAVPSIGNLSLQVATSASPRNYAQFALRFSTRAVDSLNPIFFENANSFSIPAGVSNLSIALVAGESVTETYIGTGASDQEYTLDRTPVIDNSIAIVDNLAQAWTQVDDLVDSAGTDRHFITELQPNNKVKLIFGDNTKGKAVPLAATLTISSRIGGGLNTNVNADTITTVESVPLTLAVLTATNPLKFTQGNDPESTESIRKGARAQYRQRKLLARVEEIQAYAEAFPGVARAFAQLLGRTVFIGIIPVGGGTASTLLKDSLAAAITDLIVMGFVPQVDDAQKIALTGGNAIDVEFTTLPGFDSAELESDIAADLATYLDPTATRLVDGQPVFLREFSEPLRLNGLRARLQAYVDTKAIDSDFEILSPLADVAIPIGSIFTSTGSSITATSRNVRVVTYRV